MRGDFFRIDHRNIPINFVVIWEISPVGLVRKSIPFARKNAGSPCAFETDPKTADTCEKVDEFEILHIGILSCDDTI